MSQFLYRIQPARLGMLTVAPTERDAQVLGEPSVARLLQQTLNEEKSADRTLTHIAKNYINDEAAEERKSQSGDGPLMRSAEWAGRASGLAVLQLSKGVRRVASAVGVVPDRSPRRSTGSTRTGQQRSQGCRAQCASANPAMRSPCASDRPMLSSPSWNMRR